MVWRQIGTRPSSTTIRTRFLTALPHESYHSTYTSRIKHSMHIAQERLGKPHYSDVIMNAMESQITIVYSTVYSDADQRKHQSSASLAFVRGIHRSPVNSPRKGQWRGKGFHSMTSSWMAFLIVGSVFSQRQRSMKRIQMRKGFFYQL